jgi:aspartyl-tRNA(Asn)/glutamyl-tRNA(Gln) amidotransferase subunit A
MELLAGLQISASDYLDAMRLRRPLQGEIAQIFSEVDVILAPTSPITAPRIDELLDAERRPEGKSTGRATPRSGTLIQAGNLTGLPALSLPCGFTRTCLPLGMQLVGRPFDEATVIDLGRAYQAVTHWHKHPQPLPQ